MRAGSKMTTNENTDGTSATTSRTGSRTTAESTSRSSTRTGTGRTTSGRGRVQYIQRDDLAIKVSRRSQEGCNTWSVATYSVVLMKDRPLDRSALIIDRVTIVVDENSVAAISRSAISI